MSRRKRLTDNKKVIPLLEPQTWTFWDCGDSIEAWRKGLSDESSYRLESLIKNNYKIKDHRQWTGKFKMLTGELEGEGIWEIKFFWDDKQYRLLGCFGGPYKVRREATFLLGCNHKQGVYDPPNALNTALKRKKGLENGELIHRARQIRKDL